VGRDAEVTRSEFHYLQPGMTVAQAVSLAESCADGERSCADGGR